ncbi:MAG: TonB-dependent receptor [Tannerella sp.]|jgi:TonB-linked SusC/RagA family outer membrane protein|nr:TonB-dependent receptor [Tannerella sp.]
MRKKLKILILLAWCGLGAIQAQTVVKGIVTEEENGEPIPFASIVVKGTTIGTATDMDGNYSLETPAGATVLQFSYLGMQTREETINGRAVINVALRPDQRLLDEVVVIGYGSEKMKNISGAVSNIRNEELTKASVENFQKAMQGKAAGVQITSASGLPGGAVDILIRGRGSLNASTAPLYIIDGVQVTTGDQGSGILTSTDALGGLNMDDIESIDILKDGASASIYGAQAANGVIFITTKKGAAGKTKFSFKSSVGFQNVARQIPTMTGPQFAELTLLSYKNLYGENGKLYLDKLADYQGRGWGSDGFSNAPTYDWFDAVFRTGVNQDYQLSMSGGSDKTTFFSSVGYTDDNGTMEFTWFKRISARLNVTHKINKWLEFSTHNNFSTVRQRQTSSINTSNPARSAMLIQPTNRIYDENGNYISNLEDGYYEHNILQVLDLNQYLGTTNKWTTGNDLTFTILPGLTFKSSLGVDYLEIFEHLSIDPRTRLGAATNGSVEESNRRTTRLQNEEVFNYQHAFGENHRLNAMAGFSYVQSETNGFYGAGEGVSSPDVLTLGATAIPISVDAPYTAWKTVSLFGRLGYTYQDKYILSATVRRDGSSRFGANNRFGTFPSVSGAWRISGEKFMQNLTFVNDLKLKASYGVTGNSEIGNFISRRLYQGQGAYNGQAALSPIAIGNEDLTWEESHSVNVGLAAMLFKNRLSFDVDYYVTNTRNLLYNRPIPSTTGFTVMPSNMGGIRNSGVEVTINTENVKTEKFNWSSNLNFSFTKNEVTSLIEGLDVVGNYKVGESVTSEQVYQWAGVNPSDGRPMYYDRDGYITYAPRPEDRIWIPGVDPKFFGGFTNNLSYAGLELSFTFQFQEGGISQWTDKIALLYFDGDANLYRPMYYEHWNQPGDYTWIAKPILGSLYPGDALPMATDFTTLTYEKTDFIKLKMVSLNYTLPHQWISPLRLNSAQVYIQGYNLWTTTTYPGYDPEFVGYDTRTYPQSRSFSFGLKLDF